MKIAYIAAGAAGMYCGSCLHDNTLAAALLDLGEDVLLVPTYTPLRTDEQDVSIRRIFFGGINVYLQQKFALFRHTPWWLDSMFDHRGLLERVSQRGVSVQPAQLGDMTVSMLRGEAGNQRKEVEKLVDWLITDVRPDVVHLSNSMMIGMARMLKEKCGPPVICQLSGEDLFLEKLVPPHYEQARALLARAGRRGRRLCRAQSATTPTSWPTIWRWTAPRCTSFPTGSNSKAMGGGSRSGLTSRA